eukprot:sb/3473797/
MNNYDTKLKLKMTMIYDEKCHPSIRCRETEQMERENHLLQYQNTLGVCNHVSELIGSHSATSRHVTHSRDQLTLRNMKVRILITRIVLKFGTRKSKENSLEPSLQLSICCPKGTFSYASFQLTKNYLNMTSISNLIRCLVGYHVSD